MLDIKILRDDIETIKDKLKIKGFNLDISLFKKLDAERKSLQISVEKLQANKKDLSAKFGKAKATNEDVTNISAEIDIINSELKEKEEKLNPILNELKEYLLHIPNIPDNSTPLGSNESDNLVIKKWGEITNHKGLDHLQISNDIDTELASLLAGSRFSVLRGDIAKLHRALIQFMLNEAAANNYEEYYVPFITNKESLIGTGQLPKFEEDLFKLTDDRYLISTAEIPLTNLYRNKTINKSELPIKVTAHTPCFRSEAGSYGKDTKGLIRQHQFEKVELVQIVDSDTSDQALDELLGNAENILQKLNLPYQVVQLCGGDLGFSAAKTYDIEVWLPSQQKYREISSCSNFTDFQARRLNLKISDAKTKYFAHTINGSGLAVGRTLIALIENYYDANKKIISIPDILVPFTNFKTIKV